MKGRDGVAEHQSVVITTALDNVEVVAAPGAGFQICVFKCAGTQTGTGEIGLRDAAATWRWRCYPMSNRPFYDYDEYGLFTTADGVALQLKNVALNTVKVNLTYEIRPTGM